MSAPEGPVTSRRLGLRLALLTTLIVVIPFITSLIAKRFVGAAGYEATLTTKSADVILEMETQLITLAAAFVGGLSAFVAARYGTSAISDRQLLTAAISGASGVASLIFGYGTYSTMIWMMSEGFYKPDVLHSLTIGQFWMFIVAVASFAVFAYREVRRAG